MWAISRGKSCHRNCSLWKNGPRWLISGFLLESRLLRGREGSSLLVHAFTTLLVFSLSVFPFTLHFLPLISMLPNFFLIFFATFLSHSFLLISLCYLMCLPFPPLLCTAKALLYCLPWWVLLFYPLTTFIRVWMSFPDHPLVCQLSSHHHFHVLAMPRSTPKQNNVVLFSCSPQHSYLDKGWAFFLTNSYGMHLVIPAHLSLFWVVCHPSKIVRDRENQVLSKKRFWYFFRAPLFLGKWCEVATYFLYKKKNEN